MDSKQEEELNKTLQCHAKDHILGPFVGLSPEYMEMSESKHKTVVNQCTNIRNMHTAALLGFFKPLWPKTLCGSYLERHKAKIRSIYVVVV